jgi:ABC-type branched-subunit amino acid transport system permease subunit
MGASASMDPERVMSSVAQTTRPAAPAVRVTRSRRPVAWTGLGAIVAIAVLAYLPYMVYSGTTDLLVNAFILLVISSMWNLLAGYAGLVSVGQQGFIGLGAYGVLILAQHGTNPFAALPVAAAACAVIGLPVWWLVARLRSGYFAIATWVIASTFELIISRFSSLGGGTGAPVPGMSGLDPTLLVAYTYWIALAVAVLALAAAYLMLRGRLGLVLTAVRDDEVGARSVGARVQSARRLVFIVAAAGCGAAGALLAISQLNVQPTSAFSVQFSAEMIFATIIGGIGTIEGPIIGTAVFFVLQQTLSQYGAWYLIILGLVAMVIAIWARNGIWGLIAERVQVRLFPVGYWLWKDGERPGGPRWLPALRGSRRATPRNKG